MNYMENFASMDLEDKIYALEMEIDKYENALENTSNRIKHRNTSRYLKDLRADLAKLRMDKE